MTPVWHVGLSDRVVETYEPWGADYYVVRADTFITPAPVVVGLTMVAGNDDATQGSTGWSLTAHGIAEKLFTVDKDGDIVGQVAESCTKVSDKVWDVKLKAGYKFSDGTAVTAQDVATCLKELNTVNSNGGSSLGTMTVTAPDDLTVRIESERSTHIMDSVLAEWVFTIYKKDANGKFTFTGPYVPKRFAGSHIDLVPNMYYPLADARPRVVLQKFADGDALAAAVQRNEVDVGFHLPIHTLTDVRNTDGAHVKSFEIGYQYMMHYNMRRAPLDDVKVRQAIDLAIDRTALSQALQGGHPTRSLFPDFSPYYSDTSSPAGDLAAAATLLDEAGWALSGGKRTKAGVDLTISLLAYPSRPGLVIMQPLIAQTLEGLGFTVTQIILTDDWSSVTTDSSADFDVLMWAQHTLPAGDPAMFLNGFFRTGGGSSYSGLSSTNVDAKLDALAIAENHAARVAATAEVHSAVLAEVPISI